MRFLGRSLKLILLFLTLVTTYFLFNNGKFVFGLKVEDLDRQVYDNYKELTTLDINLDLSNIVIEATDKPMIEVEYPVYKEKDLQITVAQEGQTLKIDQKTKKKFMNVAWPSTKGAQAKTIIRLPQDFTLDQINLDLSMGSLLMNTIKVKHSQMNLDMGSLDVKGAQLGAVDAVLSMGSIDFQEVELAGDSNFELSMGSLTGSMKVVHGQVKMDVSMGSVDLDMYDGYYQYKTQASMGDVNIKDSQSDQAHGDYDAILDLDVSMGDITIY